MQMGLDNQLEITSFSHSAQRGLKWPGHHEFKQGLNLIRGGNATGKTSLAICIFKVFSPEKEEKHFRFMERFDNNENPSLSQSKIEFTIGENRMMIQRAIQNNHTIGIKITNKSTGEKLYGINALTELRKYEKPILAISSATGPAISLIFRTVDRSANSKMGALVTNWARMLMITTPRIFVNSDGEWFCDDGWERLSLVNGRYHYALRNTGLNMLLILAQATMRKRIKGSCPPIVCDREMFQGSSRTALLDLLKGVTEEEGLQLLLVDGRRKIDLQNINTITLFDDSEEIWE